VIHELHLSSNIGGVSAIGKTCVCIVSFQIPDHPVLSVEFRVTVRLGAVPVGVIVTVGPTVSTPIVMMRGVVETFPAVSRTATVDPLSDEVIVRV
jgi:hypothetical protein